MRDGITDLRRTALAVACVTAMFLAVLVFVAGAAEAQDDEGATENQYQGDGCIPITTLEGNTSKETKPFGVGDSTLRIVFDTEPTTNGRFDFNSTDISVVDADNFTTIDSVTANNGRDGMFEVPLESGRYFVEASTFKQSYNIVVEVVGGDESCTGGAQETPSETPSPGNSEEPGDTSDPEDVDEDTVPNQPLPDTGGLPLVGLVVLGLVLLGVGYSIARAGIGRRS